MVCLYGALTCIPPVIWTLLSARSHFHIIGRLASTWCNGRLKFQDSFYLSTFESHVSLQGQHNIPIYITRILNISSYDYIKSGSPPSIHATPSLVNDNMQGII